jgi:glutaminase
MGDAEWQTQDADGAETLVPAVARLAILILGGSIMTLQRRARMLDLGAILDEIRYEVRPHFGKGRVASYIPALKRIPPDKFGMAVVLTDGREFSIGDAAENFSIQSISKVFTLMLAMSAVGDEVWRRVGKEPSGTPFNSLVQLEYERGIPRNPFVNAGALVVLDCVLGRMGAKTADAIRDYARVLSREFTVDYNEKVAMSELKTAHRNMAIASLLRSHRAIHHDPEDLIGLYCRQCALEMSCLDLARAFLPLANAGVSPLVQEAIVTPRQARRINALLMTCGVYDSVGSFAYRVGLPAKSGVGGGIVAIVPKHCSIAVWSPELDRSGNSLVGTVALEQFVRLTDTSIL